MTDIHLITRHNRSLYEVPMRRHHHLRHEIFVGERRWCSLARADGQDVDAYDNENTTYLLAIDGDRVVGGQRLYPTILPHMISDVFPHLAAVKGVPRASDIFEWTRYFVVKERRTGRTDCRMLAAFQEFCLEEGISQVTAVVEMWWLPRWQQSGFKVRPLGLPVVVEGQPTIAVLIDISEESLAAVRQLAGLRGASLVRRGPQSPAIHRVPYAVAS